MKSRKGVQTNFLVTLRFWIKGLEAKCYKDHVNRKEIKYRMSISLRCFETYGYISNKIKSY